MNEKTRTGLEILQASILLGVLGDLLLRPTPWGLGALVWFSLFVTGIIALTSRSKSRHLNTQTIALFGALFFFSTSFLWRDSTELNVFSVLAIVAILAIQILPALNIETRIAGIFHYVIAASWTAINVGLGPLILLTGDIKWKTLPKKGVSKHFAPVFKGLAIGIPIFLVFGGLFMAADAAFEGLIQNTFRIDTQALFVHSVFICFGVWLVAGYLRASIFDVGPIEPSSLFEAAPDLNKHGVPSITEHISDDGSNEEKIVQTDEKPKEGKESWDWRKFDNSFLADFLKLGAIETGIILGLINLLFLSFVIVQLPYLFGGMDFVQNTPDFKLAAYARRGFGELIAVASMVLPILLVIQWLLRKDNPFIERLFRILAVIQIGLLFIIMISAMQRLMLLTGSLGYGMTAERFYPMAFIVLLAMIFVVFGLTVLCGRREQFAWGALWSGLLMLGALHVMNPDDFIARTNIRLMTEGRSYDASYNGRLSDDAVPVLLKSIPLMNSANRERMINELHYQYCRTQHERDVRSWNWSRSKANHLLKQVPEIANANCADVYQVFD